jgi:hypothetical protein
MRMVLCALAQSVYFYGISARGGAYEVYLKMLEITINSLLRIAFNKPYRTNTDIIFKNYIIIILSINVKTTSCKGNVL